MILKFIWQHGFVSLISRDGGAWEAAEVASILLLASFEQQRLLLIAISQTRPEARSKYLKD